MRPLYPLLRHEGGEDYDEFCRDTHAFAAEHDYPIGYVSIDKGDWSDEIDR